MLKYDMEFKKSIVALYQNGKPQPQKCLFPYLYFKFARLSNIIKLLLLFK